MKVRKQFIAISITVLIAIAVIAIFWKPILWSLLFFGPIILVGVADILQKKQTIKNNFPVIGHFRYLLETFRPEIMQYFVETDTEGTPINREFRSLIYRRAKDVNDTTPFGTKANVYRIGYECMAHSIYPKKIEELDSHPHILIGGPDCKQPYNASILNISAMSYGSLSKNAVLAFNEGAKMGGFAHNTGEGGISQYHLDPGGDLIWQIGTGYFGCRKEDGSFCPDTFKKKATLDNVKMIEIKLSQGAKPGHGGILPAIKNTEEIAAIRHVKPFTTVLSPPYHTAFGDANGLLDFIKELRILSEGKPVGFKLCVGDKTEFTDICEAIKNTGITPDFITVDGGEGGTGAAPVEFSNSLGLPLREGLSFVSDTLGEFGLKDNIKIIASGKILTAFHMVRSMALGADLCNSARGMMIAIGCIQALQCNKNTCPTGITTQNKSLMKGLDVENKSVRAATFHKNMIHSFVEILAAAGLSDATQIKRKHILHRTGPNQMLSYEELYKSSESYISVN